MSEPSKTISHEEAVQLLMKRLNWPRERAEEELAIARESGQIRSHRTDPRPIQ